MSVCLQKGPQSFLSLHPHYYETLQPLPTLNQAGLEFCFNQQNLPEVLSEGFERPVGPHYFLSLIKRTACTRWKAMGSRDKPPWLRPLQASQPAADSTADQGGTCEPSALRNHLAELSSNCPPAELGQRVVNMHCCELQILSFGIICYTANVNRSDTKPQKEFSLPFPSYFQLFHHLSKCLSAVKQRN